MDLAQIRELLKIVAESGVAEVEIEEDEFKLIVRKNPPSVTIQPPMYPGLGPSYPVHGYPPMTPGAPSPPAERNDSSMQQENPPAQNEAVAVGPPDKLPSNRIVVKAPIVGTFYRSSSPEEKPLMELGDEVAPGDVLCIIEAMKLMNEIESEVKGIVREILVENAQPVEYDQPLFVIETS